MKKLEWGYSGIILFLLIYPFIHRIMATNLEFDPFKLNGLAMYTSYQEVSVVIEGKIGKKIKLVRHSTLSVENMRLLNQFIYKRKKLGRFIKPKKVAIAIKDQFSLEKIRFKIVTMQLKWDGMFKSSIQRFYY